jgi:uncharacterized protein
VEIYPSSKVFVKPSTVSGLGVFAKDRILASEVIEECPVLQLPLEPGDVSRLLIDYRFNFPSGTGSEWSEQVICLGFGSLYNHSNENNAHWYSDNANRTLKFFAVRDIEPGEEILTYYGSETYWTDGRTHIEVA